MNKKCLLLLLCLCSCLIVQGQERSSRQMSNGAESPRFSIRTNLVHWCMASPDLGVEWRATDRLAVLLNATWTHLDLQTGSNHHRLVKYNPEVRYYLGAAQRFYCGVEYHLGQFNFKFDSTGRQGDYQGGGISLGYYLPLRERFAIDFNLGLGYSRAIYETYTYRDNVNVRLSSGNVQNIYGVNQVGVTLVWRLF